MKRVTIAITVNTTTSIDLEEGETIQDVKGRFADIYLHGRGEDGHLNKEDLGGDSVIKIIDVEGVMSYDDFCSSLNIKAYDGGAELGASLALYEHYIEVNIDHGVS